MEKLNTGFYDPDVIICRFCENCSRHSISPEAKKQCKYLCLMLVNDKDHTFYKKEDGEIICEKFSEKKKYKKGLGKQTETLF